MEKTIIVTTLTVIITLMLNKILANYLFGIMLLIYRPFKVGDRITIMDFRGELTTGEVIKRTLLNIHILDYEQNVHIIPNVVLEQSVVVNSNKKEGVNHVNHIKISFDSNVEKAEYIVESILINDAWTKNNAENTNLLLKTAEGGLILEYNVRNETNVSDSFDLCSRIKKDIVLAFQREADIHMV